MGWRRAVGLMQVLETPLARSGFLLIFFAPAASPIMIVLETYYDSIRDGLVLSAPVRADFVSLAIHSSRSATVKAFVRAAT